TPTRPPGHGRRDVVHDGRERNDPVIDTLGKKTKWLRLASLLTILCLFAAACGGGDGDGEEEAPADDSTEEEAAADGGTEDEGDDGGDGGGEPVRLGILGECEGPFGGFHEDVVGGTVFALARHAGATVNSSTS